MNNTNADRLVRLGKLFNKVAMVFVAIGWVVPILAIVFHVLILAANTFGYDGDPIVDNMENAVWLVIAFAIFFPLYRFFQRLEQVIDSVATPDVFSVQNANHLRAMGWYLFLSQIVVSVATASTFIWIEWIDEDAISDASIELLFTLPPYLLVVVLFILAGVFRHGAEMREDLEGTV